jgi:hypothetical protein
MNLTYAIMLEPACLFYPGERVSKSALKRLFGRDLTLVEVDCGSFAYRS